MSNVSNTVVEGSYVNLLSTIIRLLSLLACKIGILSMHIPKSTVPWIDVTRGTFLIIHCLE